MDVPPHSVPQGIECASKAESQFCFASLNKSKDGLVQNILSRQVLTLPTHHARHVARAERYSPARVESCLEIPEAAPRPDPPCELLDLTIFAS